MVCDSFPHQIPSKQPPIIPFNRNKLTINKNSHAEFNKIASKRLIEGTFQEQIEEFKTDNDECKMKSNSISMD